MKNSKYLQERSISEQDYIGLQMHVLRLKRYHTQNWEGWIRELFNEGGAFSIDSWKQEGIAGKHKTSIHGEERQYTQRPCCFLLTTVTPVRNTVSAT